MESLHAERSGSGRRLVLVHGFTQTGRSWHAVAADLARDHEVVLVDAAGHGWSSAVRADLWRGGELVAEAGGEGIYVGYSMGARLALHAALSRPSEVRALALLGVTAGIEDPRERAERVAADERLAVSIERDGVDAFLRQWLALPMFAGLPDDPLALADRRRNDVAGLASSLRLAGTGTQQPLWDRLRELEMPVLVLAGERDTKFAALLPRLVASIAGSATSAVVAAAGHAAHLEAPEAFVGALRAWLESLGA